MDHVFVCFFFFQAEDGIRDVERSRGLGDVYKRQVSTQSTWVYMYNQASTSAAFNALNKSVLSISQMEAASSSCYFSRKSDNESEIELSMVLESAIERELMPNLSLIHI
eukprot:TRINITY_DN14365_c0_g1_i1.p1 TRINITY_DN14365_c0_g1~~TRINITY_DN14365_c0_g1_i1.p1  ORF type:complete len:109 (+),score=31.33 TRINITY_DN14365_c0_g1_i1:53-379(+)